LETCVRMKKSLKGDTDTRGLAARLLWLAAILFIFLIGIVYGIVMVKKGIFPYNLLKPFYGFTEKKLESPQNESATVLSGRWRPAGPAAQQSPGLTDKQKEEIDKLISLGYVSGSKPAPSMSGVTVYDRELSYKGLNFFTSGHAPEAILTNMEGKVLHKWSYDFWKVWPDVKVPNSGRDTQFWRRAYLYENGDLLAIYDWLGIIKLDRDSNLLWSYFGSSHHDLSVTDDGLIYVLDQETKIIPRINTERPCRDEFITVLSPTGKVMKRLSLLEALEKSSYAPILKRMPEWGDILHTNTIEVLDGRLEQINPAFKKGNVLVCYRALETIAVVDMQTDQVVWALVGRWFRQHQPTVLRNGHMLLFNNQAGENSSEVIEFDPFTQKIFWSYAGEPKAPFYSLTCGSNIRLHNGNTLITESDNGRAFEVTPDKTIVWEFVNPYRAVHPKNNTELIATLFEMIRLPADFPLDWLNGQ
jgi:hypothetical protein